MSEPATGPGVQPESDASPEVAADGTGPLVGRISVSGNRKIETDAVLARLATKPGERFSADRVRLDLDALFKTGYFYDVIVERSRSGDKVDLSYRVVEKPSVVQISFEGNSEIETTELKEAAALKEFEILNMTKIREASEKLQKLYEDKGFFLAKVTPKVDTVTEGESVRLTFVTQENDKVKVKRVAFLGNKNLPDGKLKDAMQTKEGGLFSFISGSGSYKQDAFERDVQLLNYLYFNEGYVQAKVERPEVYVTPDKRGIYITIRIEEGERYRVGVVDFAGDLLFDREELDRSIEIDGSGWYVHETLLNDLKTLQAKYGDFGYAYANVIPRVRTRDRDKEVDITFDIDKGNKVYFGKINVVGNSKTRDKVLRRELTIREGELYNETRRRESLANVKRLGFFEEVNFNSSTPPDSPELMNLDIAVKERNTGTIQVGAGYSTFSEFIFNGQVSQINFLGKGQRLAVSVDLSKLQSLFNFNFTEPYFLDSRWSLGVDAYQSVRRTLDWIETKKGTAVRIGHPLAPYLRGFFRYKFDNTQIDLTSIRLNNVDFAGDTTLYPVETARGDTSSGTLTLEYDRRNDIMAPTKGVFASASLEYAGIGGDMRYTKGYSNIRFYENLFWGVVFRNNLIHGFVNPNNDRAPPFNELFLLGGANNLRGYEWFSVGAKRYSERYYNLQIENYRAANGNASPPDAELERYRRNAFRPFGGRQQVVYQAELEFPLISEAGIRGVIFYDVGSAEDVLTLDGLKSNYGFGFRWFSPIGPLRFEWGFPINRDSAYDRPSVFQFAIGPTF